MNNKPMQTEWDAIPHEFNQWWDGDIDTSKNPYREDSPIYWAWEGWKAAIKQRQEPEQGPLGYWNAVEGWVELPEALRLADEMDNDPMLIGYDQHAAELRRLSAVNEELLEALEEYVNADPVDDALNPRKRKAHAAIAKAGGEA